MSNFNYIINLATVLLVIFTLFYIAELMLRALPQGGM